MATFDTGGFRQTRSKQGERLQNFAAPTDALIGIKRAN